MNNELDALLLTYDDALLIIEDICYTVV